MPSRTHSKIHISPPHMMSSIHSFNITPEDAPPHQLVYDLHKNEIELLEQPMTPTITYLTSTIPEVDMLIKEALTATNTNAVREALYTLIRHRQPADPAQPHILSSPHHTTLQIAAKLPVTTRMNHTSIVTSYTTYHNY